MRISFGKRLPAVLGLILLSPIIWIGWQWFDCLPAGLAPQYVGREACIDCHRVEYEQWRGSHHDLAMNHAKPETVLGDFADARVSHGTASARFFRNDGKFLVETQGCQGRLETFEVRYTFGVDPLQQYLVEFSDGRVQVLPFGWDVTNRKWIYVPEDENIQPDEPVYWTNRGMNWNYMCAECHSTNVRKNYDSRSNRYQTTWTDIDVSCEACHGPGSIHLAIVSRKRWLGDRRYGSGLPRLKSEARPLPVAGGQVQWMDDGVGRTQLGVCGRCHARRRVVRPDFNPGEPFLEHYLPELLDSEAYYPDGQIREENYEYVSFQMSLMHEKGVRCTDCHDPHSARLVATGNGLCVRCHVAAKYDVRAHHFHEPTGSGGQCVACHMPQMTYMRIDSRRDHSFRSPRPDLTISLGIPNACNRCHADRSAEWARNHYDVWYGKRDYPSRIDFAAAISAGRAGKVEAKPALLRLAEDRTVPIVVRASAMALLRGLPQKDLDIGAMWDQMLDHDEPLLRLEAVRALESPLAQGLRPGRSERLESASPTIVARLLRRLRDPISPVRFEAARLLSILPGTVVPSSEHETLEQVLADYQRSLELQSDEPGANLGLGVLHESLSRLELAEAAYRRALVLDASFNAARFNLGMLFHGQGRREEAIVVFEDLIYWSRRELDWLGGTPHRENRAGLAQAHYQLGLLLAEQDDDLSKAIAHLEQAATLDADRHRIHYNLGLAYQQLGRWTDAQQRLECAYRAAPTEDDYAYALAVLYSDRGKPELARDLLRALLHRNPRHESGAALLARLNRTPK
jgi:predicted CXXCH cytochrome family protein